MYVLTINSTEGSKRLAEIAHLISFPALLTAEVALIMTAFRLLVMYYPSERAKWGRYTRERPLTYGLVVVYVSMEMALWSAAWVVGMERCVSSAKSAHALGSNTLCSTLPVGIARVLEGK